MSDDSISTKGPHLDSEQHQQILDHWIDSNGMEGGLFDIEDSMSKCIDMHLEFEPFASASSTLGPASLDDLDDMLQFDTNKFDGPVEDFALAPDMAEEFPQLDSRLSLPDHFFPLDDTFTTEDRWPI